MTVARKDWWCCKCKGRIRRGSNYARWRGHEYHLTCAPKEARKAFNDKEHYPTARRAMKKILRVRGVRGFYR